MISRGFTGKTLRAIRNQWTQYVEAHPDDRPLKLALEELAFFSTEVRILGVYPAHPSRIEARLAERDAD